MKTTIYNTILAIVCIIGFFLSISEGTPYFWANFLGLFLFGTSSYLLGLFKDPHER